MENKVFFDRTWSQVNLDNLTNNYNAFRKLTENKPSDENKEQTKIMAVIKANAYGHGSVVVGKVLENSGIDYLAVASLDEAIELRSSGIRIPILLFGTISYNRCEEVIKNDITVTVFDKSLAEILSKKALENGKKVKIHIELDTGMTRLGFDYRNGVEDTLFLTKLKGLEIEGMYTHLACADEKLPDYTKMQFERFMQVVKELEEQDVKIPIKHVCNSAATIMYPEMHLDMIRVGLSMYGMYPMDEVNGKKIDLKPVMTLKSKVANVNYVKKGVKISYGGIYKTARDSRIITIPIGYADGLSRSLTNKAGIIVNDEIAPIVGKICMDQCMVDTTDVKGEIKVGDEVVIFGQSQNRSIAAEDLAKALGTINYEITCMVSRRVPRYYLKSGKVVACENYLTKEYYDL